MSTQARASQRRLRANSFSLDGLNPSRLPANRMAPQKASHTRAASSRTMLPSTHRNTPAHHPLQEEPYFKHASTPVNPVRKAAWLNCRAA